MTGANITEIQQDIFLLKTDPPGSHVYLIKGRDKNVLVDASSADNYPRLVERFQAIGLTPSDIDLVILTHEHFDHIGGATFLLKSSLLAAHSLAANKIEMQDEFTTMHRYFNAVGEPLHVHVWLEDNTLIDLGNFQLQIIYTPGHTSGCICVYEFGRRLLFSGDTLFTGGTVSDIRASGNASDYYHSLRRLSQLKIDHLYAAHGRLSDSPQEDIEKALQTTRTLFEESKLLFEALSQKVLRERARKKL